MKMRASRSAAPHGVVTNVVARSDRSARITRVRPRGDTVLAVAPSVTAARASNAPAATPSLVSATSTRSTASTPAAPSVATDTSHNRSRSANDEPTATPG